MKNLFSNPTQRPTKGDLQDYNHSISSELFNHLQISKKLLTPRDIVEIFKVKKSTVDQWRLRGDGPKFVRLKGSRLIRYKHEDVLDFINQQISVSSTTEADELKRGDHD